MKSNKYFGAYWSKCLVHVSTVSKEGDKTCNVINAIKIRQVKIFSWKEAKKCSSHHSQLTLHKKILCVYIYVFSWFPWRVTGLMVICIKIKFSVQFSFTDLSEIWLALNVILDFCWLLAYLMCYDRCWGITPIRVIIFTLVGVICSGLQKL